MKLRELFHVGDPTQSLGAGELLDHNNCKIEDKTRRDDVVLLHVRRESDDREADAYLRVWPDFKAVEGQLLSWAMRNERMIGLTLNELEYMDADVEIASIEGKMMFKRKEG